MPAIRKRLSDHRTTVALRRWTHVSLVRCIVARPRSGNEPTSVAGIDKDTDGAKASVGHLGRLNADRVSTSQLARDLLERSADVRPAPGREDLAARFACEPLQDPRACVMVVGVEHRHRVHDGWRPSRTLQYLIEAAHARVVATIADHDQRLAIARPVLDVSESPIDGVVDGTHALGWRVSEGGPKLVAIRRERESPRQARPHHFVEIDGEQLVERMT